MADSCIFFSKVGKGKLKLVMSVRVDNVFMAVNMETLKKFEEKINEKLNISWSGKVNNFTGFYYEWGYYAKVLYAETTMNKYVKKLVEGYEKYTGG